MKPDLTETVGPPSARAGGQDCLVTGWHSGASPVPPVRTGMLRPIGAPQAQDNSGGGRPCSMFQVVMRSESTHSVLGQGSAAHLDAQQHPSGADE